MRVRNSPVDPEHWRRNILEYIADHPDRPLKSRPLARALGVPDDQYAEFRQALRELVDAGQLVLGPGRRIELPKLAGVITGTFRAHVRGFGFLEVPQRPDLFVPRGRTGGALDGDVVQARVLRPDARDGRPAAEVVKVVERAAQVWVGVLERFGRRWVVRPQGAAAAPFVEVDDPTAKSAEEGDLVVVEPLAAPPGGRLTRGVIVERLGPPSETRNKILAIVRRSRIPDQFPAEVRRAAHDAAARLDPERLPLDGRLDLRELVTATIDPPDARDFDDAISLEPLADGRVRLGVHIADVAHFVNEDSPLDREARTRGNSVYFPKFVVPMLPEALSNEVCSLQPGRPRLAKSVFIEYDDQAGVIATRFANSIICSRARLTYDDVTAVLEQRKADLPTEVLALLAGAEELARRIRTRRLRDGMIVLNLPEVELKLDRREKVIDAGPADTGFSHTIIEMFMVEANEAVSRRLKDAGLPHLRRIHAPPDPDAAQSLAQLAGVLGRRPPRELDRAAILQILKEVKGRPEERAVSFVLLRTLAQATYGPQELGHFALASEDYCHFTSPIRRYPDLVNHRLLDRLLRAEAAPARRGAALEAPSEKELAELGRHCSATERRAQVAEREARHALLLEFMKDKVGETFPGIITGVTRFGAFVQVQPYMAEGLVHVSEFGPDTWIYDDATASFRGQRSGRLVALGQSCRVTVAAIDELREAMVLLPAEGALLGVAPAPGHKAPPGRRGRGGGRRTPARSTRGRR